MHSPKDSHSLTEKAIRVRVRIPIEMRGLFVNAQLRTLCEMCESRVRALFYQSLYHI